MVVSWLEGNFRGTVSHHADQIPGRAPRLTFPVRARGRLARPCCFYHAAFVVLLDVVHVAVMQGRPMLPRATRIIIINVTRHAITVA